MKHSELKEDDVFVATAASALGNGPVQHVFFSVFLVPMYIVALIIFS